ncbi:protein-disulfide reductase DsbD [Hydromonas duriensis]|uniref:Thiol:disulfide interchange protein DsbD n=1 Tax=Hydromonas duriensis TaxID=1527608 RepID=A0A4R6Y5T6_9BURK|nr:protein-disulfide reductase DsbD [Hydromonas duriensis]TDR30595.1 thiol:disulfide interchange protein DsbD [Hydromonas duriensis]
MQKKIRTHFCILGFVFVLFTFMKSASADFLPPEQAFAFSANMRDGAHAQVRFTIAPNYYMYRDDFSFAIVSPDGKVVQDGPVKLPEAQMKFDENFNKTMAIYHGSFSVNVPVKGEGLFKLVVTSRGCADGGLCYPPRKTQAVLTASSTQDAVDVAKPLAQAAEAGDGKSRRLEPLEISKPENNVVTSDAQSVPGAKNDNMPVADKKASAEQQTSTRGSTVTSENSTNSIDNSAYARDVFSKHNLPVALILMFGLGILLSLTPCMLPMVPILSSVLAGQQLVSRKRGLSLALAYVTGMAVVYALVGVLAAKTGAGLHRYLQQPWVLGVFSALLLLLALSLFDVFHIQLPERWRAWLHLKTQGQKGYVGIALMGAASALIASPCVTAPLVGVITYIAQTGNTVLGGLALFVLSYGMGLPLLLLGAGMGQFLPKAGAWMVRMKQLIGLVMIAAALWIAQPLWSGTWQKIWGNPSPAVTFQSVDSLTTLNELVFTSEHPVFVDVYADWCRSCIEMETKTFTDARVQERMSGLKRVRIDMTAYTDADAALLKHFGLYGPPAMLILEPLTGKEQMRVIGYEPPDVFIQSLDKALKK